MGRRFCSTGSGRDRNGEDKNLDGMPSGTQPTDLEEKFEDTGLDAMSEELGQQRSAEKEHVTDSGFAMDCMTPSTSTTEHVVRRGEICEEGFYMEYLTPVDQMKPLGILDHIRKGGIRRGPREWLHLQTPFTRPIPLDDGYDDLNDRPLGEEPYSVQHHAYRPKDQARLQETMSNVRPWSTRSVPSEQLLVEKENCVEVMGGGKLGNKISDVEMPVEQMRADTRESLLIERQKQVDEGNLEMVETLEELRRKIESERQLRLLCGLEYKPIMLLTIGAQGSGKSKFSLDLVEHGALPWVRINQDTIREGRRGLKADCVDKARSMLRQGYCVMIDRMNFSVGQRGEFLELAKRLECAIHAIVFRLPFVENVYNVAKRTNHEGNFEGATDLHRQIIFYTRSRLFNGGHPKSNPSQEGHELISGCRENDEGFNSVFECRSNEDYAFAFRQWMNMGRKESNGERLTLDSWLQHQQPWRIEDHSALRETEEIINEEQPWLESQKLPVICAPDLDADLPSWREDSVGYTPPPIGRRVTVVLCSYVPSRDGPLNVSDDD